MQFLQVNLAKFKKYLVILLTALAGISACTYETIPSPENCDEAPLIQLIGTSPSLCGESVGGFSVSAVGGQAPYTFDLNGGTSQSIGDFSSLSAGVYIVTVTDSKNCSASEEIVIENSDGLNIEVLTTDAACGESDGSITVNAISGQAPFSFKLDDAALQSNNVYSNLASGTYSITATDATGCTITQEVSIISSISFGTVNDIIGTNCAISGCHNGTIAPDLRSSATISDRASRINSRASAKTMPPASSGISLTDNEIAQIACWVDAGAATDN